MTRGDWYAGKYGGGWRSARKDSRCDRRDTSGMRCGGLILAGSPYFDTNTPNFYSNHPLARFRLCAPCATEELK